MPASQRHTGTGVIGQLQAAPQRFEFFQAVRLAAQWRQHGVRFRNRLALSYAPNQIESLTADEYSVRITPAFIGLLGSQGVLPLHYSERIARHEKDRNDGGPRAFLDLVSHRAVEMFYQAWARNRVECAEQAFLDMLTALAGTPTADDSIDRETLAHYAIQIRSRTVSAPQLSGMYSEYFGVPVRLKQLIGEWTTLPAHDQAQLGRVNVGLDAGIMLGGRVYNCDARARLHIGPLDKQRHDSFLPGHSAAQRLQAMLKLHCGVSMTWEVHLVQHAQDMQGVHLDANSRLGINARLQSGPADQDHDELMYLLHS
ncbi:MULTISPECIES: type VI secretion system baseplate subunit TssG [unclassified Duganella]|uniref:type VI secretion system baseplate subunit TssG n=1 Tax=unclassified Duganella TaxID=2636909 RepID=UPI000891793C|nr:MULTISPECIES: type VI secretion system baseplate subunit TssG [unclassified Duganella]SDH49205.1 type VI secretion system protein ImpH [Duganella sp. OV458]SDK64152.1 type VI secretion system protein ImpH [Duganella sp. OV510]